MDISDITSLMILIIGGMIAIGAAMAGNWLFVVVMIVATPFFYRNNRKHYEGKYGVQKW